MKKVALVILAIFALGALAVAQQRPNRRPQPKKPAPPPQQQQKPPQDDEPIEFDETVRLGTDLVNVLFSAVDSSNRVVTDLRREEVVILEDGREQQIFTFQREASLPINIAILMDLSGSQEHTFPKAKQAAGEFLRSVIRPGKDSAAFLTFQDDVELIQGLTSRLDSISRAFDEVQYSRRFGVGSTRRQATALYDAVFITADEILGREDERAPARDEVFTRRAMIVLTDGVDNASTRKLEDAIDRAWRAGVVIYAIGIGDRFRFEGVREDVLRRLSEETGGRAYFPQGADDLLDDFRQIENELRSQYLVAYEPKNTARDGQFRRIEVRIKDRDNVRVMHRRGYYAPTEEKK